MQEGPCSRSKADSERPPTRCAEAAMQVSSLSTSHPPAKRRGHALKRPRAPKKRTHLEEMHDDSPTSDEDDDNMQPSAANPFMQPAARPASAASHAQLPVSASHVQLELLVRITQAPKKRTHLDDQHDESPTSDDDEDYVPLTANSIVLPVSAASHASVQSTTRLTRSATRMASK